MRGGERVRLGQNCRRADIPELEHGWRGGGTSGSGEICEWGMDAGSKNVGAPTILFLESARPAEVSAFVVASLQTGHGEAGSDRSEDRPLQRQGQENVGAPTFSFWERRFWSAGACSRFYGVNTGTQMIVWEVGLASQKRRRAAALQNCRRADNSKNWKFAPEVAG